RGFLKAPPDRQLASLLPLLGSLCSSPESDVLNGLAKHLLEQAPPMLNVGALRQWLSRYGTPIEPGAAPRRLRVIRLTLDRDPRISGALLIRDGTIAYQQGTGDSGISV